MRLPCAAKAIFIAAAASLAGPLIADVAPTIDNGPAASSSQISQGPSPPTAAGSRRPSPEEIARHHDQLFMPLQGEAAAISPDGRHVAYSVRSGTEVSVLIRTLPLDASVAAKVTVVSDSTANPTKFFGTQQALVTWLRWATDRRLVIQTSSGHISAVDADGKNARILRSLQPSPDDAFRKNRYEMVSRPHNEAEAVWPNDRRKIVVRSERISNAAEVGDVEHAYVLLNIQTGDTNHVSTRDAEAAITAESRLVKQHWSESQVELAVHFPNRKIDVLASEPSGRWIAYSAQTLGDAGELGLLDRKLRTLTTLTPRSTNDGTTAPHVTSPVEIQTPDGGRIVCTLTMPRHPRTKLAPLVLFLPAKANEKTTWGYRPEIQALADAGFAIAEIEGYIASNPKEQRSKGDDSPKQLEHLFLLVSRLTAQFPVSTRSVALLSEAHGAQLALRAIQARPREFRAVVFIDPWTNPRSWADAADTRATEDQKLQRPALLFEQERNQANYAAPLRGNGFIVTRSLLTKVYDRQSMQELRHVFDQVTDFFYKHLYDYTTSIGATQFIEDRAEETTKAK